MDMTIVPAIAGFAFVATATPGPNNIMVMASGANFGFRPTTPHLLGVVIGAWIMMMLIGVGLIAVFDVIPVLDDVLMVVSVLYLLFLAWKIANAAPPEAETQMGQPLTFLQAALFQWVNPKAWAVGLTAITLYAPDHSFAAVAVVALMFNLIGLPVLSCWALMGIALRRFLSSHIRLRVFNYTMALLLVASLYPVFFL